MPNKNDAKKLIIEIFSKSKPTFFWKFFLYRYS